MKNFNATLELSKIAVLGLGYVGLPLLAEFSKYFDTVGFDINKNRIDQLKRGVDKTSVISDAKLSQIKKCAFTCRESQIKDANVYIVAVPTPIDALKAPDLTLLKNATTTVSHVLCPGDIVIFESTVYPGVTEEICVPILAAGSGLKFNNDFFVGYSPERINPGDISRSLVDIVKVTSGSTPKTADFVNQLYNKIILAGTFRASNIRVAEAAKVLENTQRDLNIALINELAMLFSKLSITTSDVLEAASSKWNFQQFHPGLVGGHCIGVDPYYLLHKAESIGFDTKIIGACRQVNDGMAEFVFDTMIEALTRQKLDLSSAKILILGFTFKENVADIRNTKVIDLVRKFMSVGLSVDVFDPLASPEEVTKEYGISLKSDLPFETYEGIICAVNHKKISILGADWIRRLGKGETIIYDLCRMMPADETIIAL